jgi:hypothetical protein
MCHFLALLETKNYRGTSHMHEKVVCTKSSFAKFLCAKFLCVNFLC